MAVFLFLFFLSSCQNKTESAASADPTEKEKFEQFLDSLNKGNVSEFEKVDGIRKYLALRIDIGNSVDSLAYNYYKIPIKDISPFKCLELFEQNKLTAKCGFTSHILARLYKYAGHEAYIYECGFDAPMAKHQFVLVSMNGKLIVEDAFYNITVGDSNDHPKDFLQLVSQVKAGDFSDIHVVQENVLSEMWLESKAEMDSLSNNKAYNELFQKQVRKAVPVGNRLKIMIERDYDSFTQPALEAIKPLLKQKGLSENYLSIYIKPEQIRNSDGVENDSLKKKIEAL